MACQFYFKAPCSYFLNSYILPLLWRYVFSVSYASCISLFSLIICVCSLCSLPFILELWWKYLMVLVICSDSWLQQYKLDWRFHVYGVTFSTNGLPCQVMIWINFFFFSGSISKILVITYIFNRAVQFFHGKNFPSLACRKKTLTIELLEEGKK